MLNLICLECNHTFQLDESKVSSATFNVKCPSCKKVFRANVETGGNSTKNANAEPPSEAMLWNQFRPEVELLIKTYMDTLRKEIVPSFASPPALQQSPLDSSGSRHALVCEADSSVAQQLRLSLQRMGYSVKNCSKVAEALDHLERGFYDVITINTVFPDDSEGGSKILAKVNSRKQDERRKVFVVVVSDHVKTVGPQTAFFQGANLIVPKSELKDFEASLQEGLLYFAELYRHFNELTEESFERI